MHFRDWNILSSGMSYRHCHRWRRYKICADQRFDPPVADRDPNFVSFRVCSEMAVVGHIRVPEKRSDSEMLCGGCESEPVSLDKKTNPMMFLTSLYSMSIAEREVRLTFTGFCGILFLFQGKEKGYIEG